MEGDSVSHRKLPPHDVVIALVKEQGMTFQQVADAYGASTGAVYYCFKQMGETSPKAATYYLDHIPWRIKVAHNMHPLVRKLRRWARYDLGLEQTPGDRARTEEWMAYMRESRQVVAYSPTEGPHLVQRRPEDGDGMIRRPA